MNKEVSFNYNYSARDKKEVEEIRKKYLPQSESKLDELKRLDRYVQSSGLIESLSVGIISTLIFGIGICFVLQVIGSSIATGVLLGTLGIAGMLTAYPVYRSVFTKTKTKYTPRILELTSELSV